MIRGLVVLAFALSASAQFMPPATDLNDVQRLTSEYQRLTQWALTEPSRYADALVVITSVHISLREGPALSAIDDGIAKIDQYLSKHERDEPPVSKDIIRYMKLCKTWLEDAKMAPSPDLYTLRERVLHEIMHPMQRNLLLQVEALQRVANQMDAISRMIQVRIGAIAGAAASASPEKP